ncbi:unnamed protein product, partial [Amoebophrya sp. A25]
CAGRRGSLFLLGKRYSFSPGDNSAEALRNKRSFGHFERDFNRLYRCTYRKNFAPLYREYSEDSIVAVETDAGWGCMIRVGQMLLANLMQRELLLEQRVDALKILRYFLDRP